jgi:hypothetical protein
MTRISKTDAARQQLDRAIALLDIDDISAHSLAYAAYRILREGWRDAAIREVLIDAEDKLRLGEVPGFLKHVRKDADAFLEDHSAKTVHMTIRLAIRLWEEKGEPLTPSMVEFRKRANPYEPGYRYSAALNVLEGEPLRNLDTALNATSSGSVVRRPPRRGGPN